MANIWFSLLGIVIYATLVPFLGKKIYPIKGKKLISLYFIGIGIIFAFNMVFMGEINPSNAGAMFQEVVTQLDNPMLYVLFMFYMGGGMGIFGSSAEKSAEIIEDINLFKQLKKSLSVKRYIMFAIYGSCFLFSIYSANEIFVILMDIQYKPAFSWFNDFWIGLGYDSVLIVLLGITFFCIKAFRLGFFSFEYWRADINTRKEKHSIYRKLITIFLYVWASYLAFMISFIESNPILVNPFDVDFNLLNLVFHIFTVTASLIFYTNMGKIVDALKPSNKDFKKKIDEDIIIEPENDLSYDNDLKFD
jgi:hypothetical protein